MPCSTTFVAREILSQASDGDDLKARLSATFPDFGGRVCSIKIRKSYKSESHILTSRPNALNNWAYVVSCCLPFSRCNLVSLQDENVRFEQSRNVRSHGLAEAPWKQSESL